MADTIDDSKTKLILKNVYATYVNEKNDKYGRSIAVLAYDELGGHIQEDRIDEITKWVEENKIGSGDKAGKPHFTHFENEFETSECFYFKPGRDTEYTDLNGQKLSFSDIKPNSKISIVARAFPYKYKKDGKEVQGVSNRLSTVIVMEMGESKAYEDTKDLLDELVAEENKEVDDIPF